MIGFGRAERHSPLIRVWFLVRVRAGPPAFAREASKAAAPKPIGRRRALAPRATARQAIPARAHALRRIRIFTRLYAARNSDRIGNDLGANNQVISMAPTTSRPSSTACLQVLPTTESQHARCLLLFSKQTSQVAGSTSALCQQETHAPQQKAISDSITSSARASTREATRGRASLRS